MTVLGAIADDFTGATDLAGLLARSGYPVSLRIGVPEAPPIQTAQFEIIALKIRTAPANEAVAEAKRALAWLRNSGAVRFFWKYCSTFDSTADGNIGPVAEALMAELGATQTIYCPAFPENGRSVYMGNLFVGRELLSESSMKDHPLTPMRDANLLRLLAPQVRGDMGLVDLRTVSQGPKSIRSAIAASPAHVIVDGVTERDLISIAEACHGMRLITGGSAVAEPLPSLYSEAGLLTLDESAADVPDLPNRAVILSGSCSKMSREQVATYAKKAPSFRLDPLELARHGTGPALEWLIGQLHHMAPIIYATASPKDVREAQSELGISEAGEVVENAFAELAIAARDLGVRRFVVAGGETSGAVTQALGVDRLDIGAEISPGVPWTFAVSDDARIALALKSGNFGRETFFFDALAALER